jgi:hypothetical protein
MSGDRLDRAVSLFCGERNASMNLTSFDAELTVTPANVERLSADVRASVRAGATRIVLTIAPASEWSDEGTAVFSRECQRICTWLVGLLGAGKPAPRIAVDLPDGSRLSACYAAAMQPYAALLRRQARATRLTTALVAATVAGVTLTGCGGTTTGGASDGGYAADGSSGTGGYGAGVCAVGTGGFYGGGVCAVAVDATFVGTGGYAGGVCPAMIVVDAGADADADADAATILPTGGIC